MKFLKLILLATIVILCMSSTQFAQAESSLSIMNKEECVNTGNCKFSLNMGHKYGPTPIVDDSRYTDPSLLYKIKSCK